MECTDGCTCAPLRIGAHAPEGRSSVMARAGLMVQTSTTGQCTLHVTTNHTFKVMGVSTGIAFRKANDWDVEVSDADHEQHVAEHVAAVAAAAAAAAEDAGAGVDVQTGGVVVTATEEEAAAAAAAGDALTVAVAEGEAEDAEEEAAEDGGGGAMRRLLRRRGATR